MYTVILDRAAREVIQNLVTFKAAGYRVKPGMTPRKPYPTQRRALRKIRSHGPSSPHSSGCHE